MRVHFIIIVALFAGARFAAAQEVAKSVALAEVDGRPIYESDLTLLIGVQLRQIRSQEYDLRKRALDEAINQRLVETEAKRRGITAEALVQLEADATVTEPTPVEVEAFYLAQRDRIDRPLAEVRSELQRTLSQLKVSQARMEYVARLRDKSDLTILLRPPQVEVDYDPERLRGSPDAPVLIIEFSDFQCPFCRNAQPSIKQLLAKYGSSVSLAYRDFPLREIHPLAQKAAEASRCMLDQGRFWEYHDLLYASASKLGLPELTAYANSLGADMKAFEACLGSGKYAGEVEKDLQAGTSAGVTGTPSFFVNGVFTSGFQSADVLERLIEAELKRTKTVAP